MAKKTIITIATTGAWPKKENNPNVPMTPQEIAEDVYDCWKAGAAVAHLHMRDDEGNGTMSTDKFRETVKLIRELHPDCDIVLNLTTSGDLHATDETRQAHLKELRPEMEVPVIGVVGPGAKTAAEVTKNGKIGVIGTEGTIDSGIYTRFLSNLRPDIQVLV